MPSIYLDESGQFAKDGGNKYFVVASFTVADPRITHNDFRVFMRSKMPRVIRDQPEIKFSDLKIDDKLRLKTLETIATMGVQIRYSYLNKSDIPNSFRYKGVLKEGHLYAYVVAETIESYLPTSDKQLRVHCDERHLKDVSKQEFSQSLEAYLASRMTQNSLVQVTMEVSHDNVNIQISDWIAGALAWHHNGRPLGNDCYRVLENSLLAEGKELFKDHWLPKL